MKLSVEKTQDGWATLYLPEQDEHYHSMFGAFEEARWIYIERGFGAMHAIRPAGESLRILEMGFGTGLNAILTVRAAEAAGRIVRYTGVEAYPLPDGTIEALGYAPRLAASAETKAAAGAEIAAYGMLHRLPWSAWRPDLPFVSVSPHFSVCKVQALFQNITWPAAAFDLIYYDAFSPRVQPELWTDEVACRLYAALAPGGRLVTYCAQGRWKKNLVAAGFNLSMLPGPGGKREITSAEKQSLSGNGYKSGNFL